MRAFYKDKGLRLYLGDCRDVMASLPENSIDAIVTDPPYELGFMGKSWDNKGVAFDVETWKAALRVLKPGSHMVAFGAPRNYHRLAVAIEDAGFEVRDTLMWIFGSGFPKSLNLHGDWEGWGTALKPAYEPIVLARKPLSGTVASNVAQWGTGGLNIDATRIGDEGGTFKASKPAGVSNGIYGQGINGHVEIGALASGRWPANVLLDEDAACLLDAVSTQSKSADKVSQGRREQHDDGPRPFGGHTYRYRQAYGDDGGASRFFYTAKASRSEREAGLHDLDPSRRSDGREKDIENPRLRTNKRRNDHPTVKPIALMRWLCRLVTPPNGVILDPFLGSGSTGAAALYEIFRFVGIDLSEAYLEIAKRRIINRGQEIYEAPDGSAHKKSCRFPMLPCICKK